jgi:Flp pilus assembly protein TadB
MGQRENCKLIWIERQTSRSKKPKTKQKIHRREGGMKDRKEEEKILEEDIKEFLEEKERIRDIIGKIGGTVTLASRLVNLFWIIAVVLIFVVSIFVEDTARFIMIEVGILLVSTKVIYYFHRQAKINHFQFWILTSIEWRVNEIAKKFNEFVKKQ